MQAMRILCINEWSEKGSDWLSCYENGESKEKITQDFVNDTLLENGFNPTKKEVKEIAKCL